MMASQTISSTCSNAIIRYVKSNESNFRVTEKSFNDRELPAVTGHTEHVVNYVLVLMYKM